MRIPRSRWSLNGPGTAQGKADGGHGGAACPRAGDDHAAQRAAIRPPHDAAIRPGRAGPCIQSEHDEDVLNRAYVYAMHAHGEQTRASGDPYSPHPLEVAAILTDLKLDDATIVAALLHDTIEDTEATRD